jgi:phage terminase large subunit-like protein
VRNYTNVAKAYAAGIVSGSIPACLQMKQAAQRFLDNLKSKIWRFDEAKAHHACAFIELLPHTKGELARKRERMHLEPWQVFAIVNIFGFVDDQGLRKYREVFLLIPRKNGKSQLAA